MEEGRSQSAVCVCTVPQTLGAAAPHHGQRGSAHTGRRKGAAGAQGPRKVRGAREWQAGRDTESVGGRGGRRRPEGWGRHPEEGRRAASRSAACQCARKSHAAPRPQGEPHRGAAGRRQKLACSFSSSQIPISNRRPPAAAPAATAPAAAPAAASVSSCPSRATTAALWLKMSASGTMSRSSTPKSLDATQDAQAM